MNKKYLFLLCTFLVFLVTAGCGFFRAGGTKKAVKLYTTLDKNLVEALCVKFSDNLPKDKRFAFEIL